MTTRSPRSSGSQRRRQQPVNSRMILIIILVVLVIAAAVLLISFLPKGEQEPEPTGTTGSPSVSTAPTGSPTSTAISDDGKIKSGVTISGVDVSGKTRQEAMNIAQEKADELLKELSISYTAMGGEYTLSADQLGATVDVESAVESAMSFGRGGTASATPSSSTSAESTSSVGASTGASTVSTSSSDFPIAVELNEDTIKESLATLGKEYIVKPQSAKVSVQKYANESNLAVDGKLVYTKDVPGKGINEEKLIADITAAIQQGNTTTPIVAQEVTTEAKITEKYLRENTVLRDNYRTDYKSSDYYRRYNIWKMSTVVNGVVLQPGEIWSINDAAGPRTAANGWKDAPGIKNGEYVDEPGGGICQVSSTLYLALIKSEVKIEDRKHHSWPLTYVPVGLDATISTYAPDFKYKNNFDTPIAVIVRCDGKNAKNVQVSVYGPPMDYEVKFESKIVKQQEPGPYNTTFDPSLKPGASKWTKLRKNYIQAEITKLYYEKGTGKLIRSEPYSTETYRAFEGTIAYGPSATPKPSATAKPSATPKPSNTAEPTEKPTAEPTEKPTAEPTEKPTTEPKPTATKKPDPTEEPVETPKPTKTSKPDPTPSDDGELDWGEGD